MKLALVQMEPKLYDKEANLAKIIHYIDEAADEGADLVAFPELILTGYMCRKEFHKLAEAIPGPSTARVENKAKERKIYVTFGIPEIVAGCIYNSAPFFGPKGLIGIYRKSYLPTFIYVEEKPGSVYEEGLFFKVGSDVITFDTEFGKVGVEICYDFWYPELVRIHALRGACLVLNISALPHPLGPLFQLLARARAAENVVWFGYINQVGTQKDVRFAGGTCIVDPATAEIIASASMGEQAKEEMIIREINLNVINSLRIELPILRDVRPEILQKLYDVARQKYFPRLGE